jgi:hypothetical protein
VITLAAWLAGAVLSLTMMLLAFHDRDRTVDQPDQDPPTTVVLDVHKEGPAHGRP